MVNIATNSLHKQKFFEVLIFKRVKGSLEACPETQVQRAGVAGHSSGLSFIWNTETGPWRAHSRIILHQRSRTLLNAGVSE
jgi:hypothetical protein